MGFHIMWFDRIGSCVAFLHKFVTSKLVGVVLTDTNKTSHYTLVLFCSHVPRIPLRSPLASPILSLTDRTLVLVLLLLNYRQETLSPHSKSTSRRAVVFASARLSFVSSTATLVGYKKHKHQIYSCINTCPQNVTVRRGYAAIWYVLK